MANNQWREVTSKQGIEQGCIQENIKKYCQTEDTPCMVNPLREELGYTGTTRATEEILQGTYTYPRGTSRYSRELLQEFSRKEILSTLPPDSIMTTDNFVHGWQKMK